MEGIERPEARTGDMAWRLAPGGPAQVSSEWVRPRKTNQEERYVMGLELL